MLTSNITTLMAKITDAGFRFEESNPIAVETYIQQASTNPAWSAATFDVTYNGERHQLSIVLIPKQGYFSVMDKSECELESIIANALKE